ncbi:unnamed protein product, partial [Owenia fusiformis]
DSELTATSFVDQKDYSEFYIVVSRDRPSTIRPYTILKSNLTKICQQESNYLSSPMSDICRLLNINQCVRDIKLIQHVGYHNLEILCFKLIYSIRLMLIL